jgi:phasin family protein
LGKSDYFVIVRCNNLRKQRPTDPETDMTVKATQTTGTKKATTEAKKAAKATVTTFNPLIDNNFFKEITMFQGNKQFEKLTQDSAAMGQDQMDAVSKAAAIWSKGMEDIMKTCMEIAQNAGEKSASATKSVMACKTLNEFTEVQTKLAQASFDEFMSNATKLSELSVKVCTDAAAPINDQMGKAIKKASDAVAA